MKLRAVVGLGANLGDRLTTMRSARRELGLVAEVIQTSHVYETAPVGGPPQPTFLNAAVLVLFDGAPTELLDALLAIERRLGRIRLERWGPRVIDLDLLWINGLTVATPRLIVPHPCLRERAFALAPMLELAPGARDPGSGKAYVVPPGELTRTADLL